MRSPPKAQCGLEVIHSPTAAALAKQHGTWCGTTCDKMWSSPEVPSIVFHRTQGMRNMARCAHRKMMHQPWMTKQQSDASNFMPRFSASSHAVQFQSGTCCIHPLFQHHTVKT